MKIDHIEVITLRFEYENGYIYAGGRCSARVTTLVRVHTDTGDVGLGSGYSHPGLLHLIIERQLAPLLLGEDPTDVERLWEMMYQVTRWYGRKGAAVSALGALDTAFWDLRGKNQDKPVWSLLGGDRTACPAYASGLLWSDVADLKQEALRHRQRGFRRAKMRLGRDPELDVAAVRAVHGILGDDNVLVDGSMRYSVDTARQLADVLAECKVLWFEEPFEPEDIDSYAALRDGCPVPVAAGENEFGFQGFRELIRAGAVDIVQPDASRCGGISEVRRVAELAKTAGLRVAPHTWSDAVTITANAHVVASIDHGLTVEMDQTGNPFVEQLLVEPPEVRDGQLTLSSAPGLGIELNQSTIDRYRLADPLEIPDGLYSDMVFGRSFLN
ncbi:MAG: mandelate racemase/muconate lactonizing enzyme family protein [Fuerstiella sp.]|nr:mandelate racemase/muconate lactonizing enzyme family protein [Fuerstiella sp.]